VDFQDLIGKLEDIIGRKFHNYKGYKMNFEKILKVVLSENDSYSISEKSLSYELAFLEK
jgi:hypothetical protein